jgi:outer membrane protein assembly factor BamC
MKNVPLPSDVERPSPLKVSLIYLGVQKRSTGDRQWLFIDKQASQVWPELENYFNENTLEMGNFEARKGISETKFLNTSGSYLQKLVKIKKDAGNELDTSLETITNYRFQILLQPGLQRNTSKLQILVSTDYQPWPKISDSLAIEEMILDDLAQYLGQRLEENSSISLLAQQMIRKFEVEIINEEGAQPYMLINQDFNESWPLVGKAIRDASMPLYDVNRSFGLFYLSTVHEEANKHAFTKTIKTNRQFSSLEKHEDFQIYLAEEENGVVVRVQINDEMNVDPQFAIFILKALQKSIVDNKP